MEDNKDNNLTKEDAGQKKKQKAGLNAVRPDDFVEMKFKDMASDKKLSQTEMFERMFWSYIKKEREEEKRLVIDYTSEINLISKDFNNIMNHFKGITEKAQETVLNITANADQTQKNLTLEIDTLKKHIEELEKRNSELEETNKIFSEIKDSLEDTISNQNENLKSKELELTEVKATLKEKELQNKDQDKSNKALEKSNEKLQKENDKLSEELRIKESRIIALETSNSNLQSTLSNVDTLKKAEIESIDARYRSIISNHEHTIKGFNDAKEKELKDLENRVRNELDAEKKMAIADMKLELVDVKSKYAESLANIEKLHADYVNRVNSLQNQHKQDIEELQVDYTNRANAQQEQYKQELADAELKFADMESKYTESQMQINKLHTDHESQIKKYSEKINLLEKEIKVLRSNTKEK